MRLTAPLTAPGAPATRLDPVAKLAAAAVLSVGLLISVDPVTPAIVLVALAVTLPFAGLRWGALVRRGWPLLISAVTVALVNVLFSTEHGGAIVLTAGPVRVTGDALGVGLGLALRVLAIALPGLVAFATTDPTELADGLIQHLRVPPRFAIGALAAYRLLPLLASEWELLTLARRARGVDAGRNPIARLRLFAATVFALLVGAIRRGTRLATAMDARGFDAGVPRTVARPQRFDRADAVLLVAAVAVIGAALATSIALGTFRPLVG